MTSVAYTQSLQPYQAPADKDVAAPAQGTRYTGIENNPAIPFNETERGPATSGMLRSATFTETIIGSTVYDLQSNASVQNRLAQTNGQLSAGWTFSSEDDGYTDRGTGYNFKENDVFGQFSLERIEAARVGWPSIIHTAGGKELSITHAGSGGLNVASADLGTGSWTESTIDTDITDWLLWPRAVSGGADGNSIHLVCISAPVANGGQLLNGQDGAIIYYRSTDQGATWDISDMIFPQLDSASYARFDGDSYSIFARGDKVAFAVFNDWDDSFVMISEDNGDNWEKTNLVTFPVDGFDFTVDFLDIDQDAMADTVTNADGSGNVFISSDMNTHVVYGNMRYLDEATGDDTFNYFPFTDGLEYWNENFGPDSSNTIAVTMDMNDDGEILLAEDLGAYFTSMTGLPNMSEDEDGHLYVSYSGVHEEYTNGSQNYRHLFFTKSDDGGMNWTEPVDGTPDLDFWGYEAVFASMAPLVDTHIHLIYQRDTEPGLHVRGDEDPANFNDIIYYRLSKDLFIEEVINVEEVDFTSVEIFPNPASSAVNIILPNMAGVNLSIHDITGKVVLGEEGIDYITTLDVSSLASGVYVLNLEYQGQVNASKLIIE